MSRRSRPIAALTAACLALGVAAGAPPSSSAPTAPGRVAAAATPFTLDWAKPVTNQRNISMSSPVVVTGAGTPFVVTGDLGGNLRAFRLHDGAAQAGWSGVNAGFELKAPLSTDGSNVYVPVAQDGKDRVPQFKKYRADGSLVWNTNVGTVYPGPGHGFLLAGMSLAKVNGVWRAYGASSGHWVYGFNGTTGWAEWGFRNADSTMATPALADLYGTGAPAIITSNDKTAETSADRHGGHLRIFTTTGRQICSADQTVTGNTYVSSGYNNSSPIVGAIGGDPLIVFGSTGPVQTGPGANQVVAYNSNCGRRWASPPLAGRAEPSPTFADVRGDDTPEVIQLIAGRAGSVVYPRVYVLDAKTGQVLSDTGTSLQRYGGNISYPQSTSIATADVDADGKQDLFVPGTSLVVLKGQTMGLIQAVNTAGVAVQNTPVITQEPGGGLRVTLAGYSANNGNGVFGGTVRSYTTPTGVLGPDGWPRFGRDSQLTGLFSPLAGPYDTLLEGRTLPSGRSLRSRTGGRTATMQPDGNFVVRRADGSATFQTRTSVPGSYLYVGVNGNLVVKAPDGRILWQTGKVGPGHERVVLGGDGLLRVFSGTWSGSERTNRDALLWITPRPT
ncbi:MAG TPA: hypothetical protein VHK88_03945 [Aquihabitans sp.]|nr:hypothetical protein [Aquihabitans sp.]